MGNEVLTYVAPAFLFNCRLLSLWFYRTYKIFGLKLRGPTSLIPPITVIMKGPKWPGEVTNWWESHFCILSRYQFLPHWRTYLFNQRLIHYFAQSLQSQLAKYERYWWINKKSALTTWYCTSQFHYTIKWPYERRV